MAELIAAQFVVDTHESGEAIYLYHGTNCYRRFEINRSSTILPGRSGYSFFCTRAADAYTYARAAAMRDGASGSANSLSREPVVLKVLFTARTWIQADFIQKTADPSQTGDLPSFSIAVLGPVPSANVAEVLHCSHGKCVTNSTQPVRSFADGSLQRGIARLREKTAHWRLDTWVLSRVGSATQDLVTRIGGEPLELTVADEVRRLHASSR